MYFRRRIIYIFLTFLVHLFLTERIALAGPMIGSISFAYSEKSAAKAQVSDKQTNDIQILRDQYEASFDSEEQMQILEKMESLAVAGSAEAAEYTGFFYLYIPFALRTPETLEKATYWLDLAARRDRPAAAYWLTRSYYFGEVLEKDVSKARDYFCLIPKTSRNLIEQQLKTGLSCQ